MKEKEIIQKVINLLGNIENAKIISVDDFTEDREAFMIVVGIEAVEQLNPNLPDYRFGLNITVDTFIEDDRSGEIFSYLVKNVCDKINMFINKQTDFEVAFQGIPVVGWLNLNTDFSITPDSNRCVIKSDLITSFN